MNKKKVSWNGFRFSLSIFTCLCLLEYCESATCELWAEVGKMLIRLCNACIREYTHTHIKVFRSFESLGQRDTIIHPRRETQAHTQTSPSFVSTCSMRAWVCACHCVLWSTREDSLQHFYAFLCSCKPTYVICCFWKFSIRAIYRAFIRHCVVFFCSVASKSFHSNCFTSIESIRCVECEATHNIEKHTHTHRATRQRWMYAISVSSFTHVASHGKGEVCLRTRIFEVQFLFAFES